MKAKKIKNKSTIFFVTSSILCLFILVITLTLLKNILKVRAEQERNLNYYNYQVQQFRKSGDPLITPAYK